MQKPKNKLKLTAYIAMIYVVIKKKTAEDCSTDLPHASKHVTT
jgi:hypothetical protein